MQLNIGCGEIYATNVTGSNSEGEHQEPHIALSDDEREAAQRAKQRFRRMNDPSSIRNPQHTTSPFLFFSTSSVPCTNGSGGPCYVNEK